jgi:hypothetical protein
MHRRCATHDNPAAALLSFSTIHCRDPPNISVPVEIQKEDGTCIGTAIVADTSVLNAMFAKYLGDAPDVAKHLANNPTAAAALTTEDVWGTFTFKATSSNMIVTAYKP